MISCRIGDILDHFNPSLALNTRGEVKEHGHPTSASLPSDFLPFRDAMDLGVYLSGTLCFIASTSSGEDRQEQDRGEPVPLVLRRRRAFVPGAEVGEQRQDIVRSENGLVQFKLDL